MECRSKGEQSTGGKGRSRGRSKRVRSWSLAVGEYRCCREGRIGKDSIDGDSKVFWPPPKKLSRGASTLFFSSQLFSLLLATTFVSRLSRSTTEKSQDTFLVDDLKLSELSRAVSLSLIEFGAFSLVSNVWGAPYRLRSHSRPSAQSLVREPLPLSQTDSTRRGAIVGLS